MVAERFWTWCAPSVPRATDGPLVPKATAACVGSMVYDVKRQDRCDRVRAEQAPLLHGCYTMSREPTRPKAAPGDDDRPSDAKASARRVRRPGDGLILKPSDHYEAVEH